MPFKPGQGGRPKGASNKVGKAARDIWAELGGPDGAIYAKALHAIAITPSDNVHAQLKALALIAPHIWTKKAERHELTGVDGQPILFTWQQP